MSDDGPRAGLLTTHADKKERRNEKVRRAQKTKRTLVLVFLRKETVVVVGRATDGTSAVWILVARRVPFMRTTLGGDHL